ncbi:hypothetical protein BDZ45DRAFT_732789 [Acephala macrosclerotiorum]|nr:hypothetical protein BDZ45DRAFT_732789 [Acephala macrosclerotiorum]
MAPNLLSPTLQDLNSFKSKEVKSWVFTKSAEYTRTGVLQLGQVLLDPYEPSSALFTVSTLCESMLVENPRSSWTHFNPDVSSFTLPANLVGPLLKGSNRKQIWKPTRLEVSYMEPDMEYIRKIFQHENVKQAFGRFTFKKRIYLVVGVRTFYGFHSEDSSIPSPRSREQSDSFIRNDSSQKSSDFVFAYRLQKISFTTKIRAEPFESGDQIGNVLGPVLGNLSGVEFSRDEPTSQGQLNSVNQVRLSEDAFSDSGYASSFGVDLEGKERPETIPIIPSDPSVIVTTTDSATTTSDAVTGDQNHNAGSPISRGVDARLDGMSARTTGSSALSSGSGQGSTNLTANSTPELLGEADFELHDTTTVYTTSWDDRAIGSRRLDHWKSELATNLVEALAEFELDAESMEVVVESLPDHLVDFASRIGGEGKTQIYRDIMGFCSRYRHSITERFQDFLDERRETMESRYQVDGSISLEEMMQRWTANLEGVEPEEMEVFDTTEDGEQASNELEPSDGADDGEDKVSSQMTVYRKLVLASTAYRHLLANLRREMLLETPNSSFITAIRRVMLPVPRKVSRKQAPLHCSMVYRVPWEPIIFIKDQKYREEPGEAIENGLTLTGIGHKVESLTCKEFLCRNWPLIGAQFMALIKAIVGEGKKSTSKARLVLQDGSALEASIIHSSLTLAISGVTETVAEIGEMLAWISAALRSHPYVGLVSCTPFVKDFVREYKDGERTSMLCEIDYQLEEIEDSSETSNGRCWRALFRNPIVVRGFKIRRRPRHLIGLESSLNIMTSLVETQRIAIFGEKLFIKGFCTMLIPTQREADVILWHTILNEDGGRIAYTDPRLDDLGSNSQAINGLTFPDLENARHIVGWCSTVVNRVGSAGVNVTTSGLARPAPGYVFERLTISAGQYVTVSGALALGIKDKPERLTSADGYGRQLRSIAAKYVLLYDNGDGRAWLVDGASALLQLVRASLNVEASSGFASTHSPLREAAATKQGRDAAITILEDDHNRKLKLFKNKHESWQEVTIKPDGTHETVEKEKITYYDLQDRVNDIYHILDLIQTHQENKISRDGIGYKVKFSPRRQLEGFDFYDVASAKQPMWSRATNLKPSGKGWVDFARAIDAITLFGVGFGDLMSPLNDSTGICRTWHQVPEMLDYLTVGTQVLKKLLVGDPSDPGALRVADDIYWHTPDKSFEACHCTESQHCDRVQVLLPTSFPKMWGRSYRHPLTLPADGAVIFGHSWKFPLRWSDQGDPAEVPAEEATQDTVSNDSGIGLAGSSHSIQAPSSQSGQARPINSDEQPVGGWRRSTVQRLKRIGGLPKRMVLKTSSNKSSGNLP